MKRQKKNHDHSTVPRTFTHTQYTKHHRLSHLTKTHSTCRRLQQTHIHTKSKTQYFKFPPLALPLHHHHPAQTNNKQTKVSFSHLVHLLQNTHLKTNIQVQNKQNTSIYLMCSQTQFSQISSTIVPQMLHSLRLTLLYTFILHFL